MKEVLVECNIFLLGLVMLVSISLGVEFLVCIGVALAATFVYYGFY